MASFKKMGKGKILRILLFIATIRKLVYAKVEII